MSQPITFDDEKRLTKYPEGAPLATGPAVVFSRRGMRVTFTEVQGGILVKQEWTNASKRIEHFLYQAHEAATRQGYWKETLAKEGFKIKD